MRERMDPNYSRTGFARGYEISMKMGCDFPVYATELDGESEKLTIGEQTLPK